MLFTETPRELEMLKDRFLNLDELNYLARRMESFDGLEYDQFLSGISKLKALTEKDIVKLIDGSRNTVVEYTYDSWGKLISTTGSLATSLGSNQPFRYRGYVYDTETGWYYLQSRYYNPEVGRFISSDVYLSTGQGVSGHNSYAYCLNNPVNMVDSNGEFGILTAIFISCCVAGLAIGIQVGHNTAENNGYTPDDGWDYWKEILKCGAIGAGIGAGVGAVACSIGALIGIGGITASASWAGASASIGGSTAYALGSKFEQWFYDFFSVPDYCTQVKWGSFRFDAVYNNMIVELKNYNWSCYGGRYSSIISRFITQAQNYMNVVGYYINGQRIENVLFVFSSKPPQEVIKALESIGVIVDWIGK